MRFVRFVCLFAIFMSMLLLAQSSSDQLANPPNGLPIAQRRHLPPNLSQMPQGAPFAQRGAGAFKDNATRRRSSSSGLNFAPAVAYGSGGWSANSVAVGDLNGDGKPDLVIANPCASSSNCGNSTVGVLLGNGDGTFQTVVAYDPGGNDSLGVAVADVNGDGKPDLVVANECASSSNCNDGTVRSSECALG